MTVGDKMNSDHHSVEVRLEGEVKGKKSRGKVRKLLEKDLG